MFTQAEEVVRIGVQWLRLLTEDVGAIIIATGIVMALQGLLRHWRENRHGDFNPVRLSFARYLAMALEFQFSTAVAPSWAQLGKLATVAVIRTGLNYFLMREIREERGRERAG